MDSLSSLYLGRFNKSGFVCCQDGIIAIKSLKFGRLIVHASVRPKTFSICEKCDHNSIVIEIFNEYKQIFHFHVNYADNVKEIIETKLDDKITISKLEKGNLFVSVWNHLFIDEQINTELHLLKFCLNTERIQYVKKLSMNRNLI
jgi:hypothetical protein